MQYERIELGTFTSDYESSEIVEGKRDKREIQTIARIRQFQAKLELMHETCEISHVTSSKKGRTKQPKNKKLIRN